MAKVTEQLRVRGRRPSAVVAAATMIATVVIAAQQHTGPAPSAARLPSSAQQWVDQWMAASLKAPDRACGRLFAPALARGFQSDTGHRCGRYYRSATIKPFRVRHVLEYGGTAAVEAQDVGAGRGSGYFTIVLSHLHRGWQAIDVVPGRSAGRR